MKMSKKSRWLSDIVITNQGCSVFVQALYLYMYCTHNANGDTLVYDPYSLSNLT